MVTLEAARLGRGRAKAALEAAFVIAIPFLTFPVVFGVFGFIVWLCMFVPALLGIVLVQLPAKLLADRWQWRSTAQYGAVLAANVTLTLGLALLIDTSISGWIITALVAAAIVAASIWQAFDERALSGPALRYSQGSYNG